MPSTITNITELQAGYQLQHIQFCTSVVVYVSTDIFKTMQIIKKHFRPQQIYLQIVADQFFRCYDNVLILSSRVILKLFTIYKNMPVFKCLEKKNKSVFYVSIHYCNYILNVRTIVYAVLLGHAMHIKSFIFTLPGVTVIFFNVIAQQSIT